MKPGLYVATVRDVEEVQVWGPNERGDYATLDPVGIGHLKTRHIPSDVTDARPLVVLDPESDEDVADVSLAFRVSPGHARCALRALAIPTPAEPMGLGAVVRFDDGRLASRVEVAHDYPWAIRGQAGNYSWGFLSANNTIEVLSDGWTP